MSISIFPETKTDEYLNLANGNFSTLWNSLGLDALPTGDIPPGELLNAINQTDALLLVRVPDLPNNGREYSPGINLDMAEAYLRTLTNLCISALECRCNVVWV